MRYTRLGERGPKVSRIAFGNWSAGGDWGGVDRQAAIAAMREALDLGITLFDTARAYGFGAAEELLGEARTAPSYRIYSIGDVHPGMFEVEAGGISVPGEIYRLPDEVWARVEAGEPPNLYKGPVKLSDGRTIDGILYPRELAEGIHRDISEFGGWREYVTSLE